MAVKKEKFDPKKIIVEQLISLMENGVNVWSANYHRSKDAPRNAITQRPYNGMNVFVCSAYTDVKGYKTNQWLTFNQAKANGLRIKKDQCKEYIKVYFWQISDRKVKDEKGKEEIKKSFFLKVFNAYNVDQLEDEFQEKFLTDYKEKNEFEKENEIVDYELMESIYNNWNDKCVVQFSDKGNFYNPKNDYINLVPKSKSFSDSRYYSTMYHEMIHATGSETRLKREGVVNFDRFGSHQYSKEELIAELGAAMLCAHVGIFEDTKETNASYLKHWIEVLKSDPSILFSSYSSAKKSVESILEIEE